MKKWGNSKDIRIDIPNSDLLKSAFLEHFNLMRDSVANNYKLVSEDEKILLDSHKLAALAILAVKKAEPVNVYIDGKLSYNNLYNEFVAARLAHAIMFNVRRHDYSEKHKNTINTFYNNFTYPNAISENKMTATDRFFKLLAHINMTDTLEVLMQNIRQLGYNCYLLDVYHRGLLGHLLLSPLAVIK